MIIEPHPDVLQHMRHQGWYEKEGVKILEGKWQDFVNSDELLNIGGFDVIYTDTFSEDYAGMEFVPSEQAPIDWLLQNCTDSSDMYQTYYQVRSHGSASLMAWGPPVCANLPRLMSSLTSGYRCYVL